MFRKQINMVSLPYSRRSYQTVKLGGGADPKGDQIYLDALRLWEALEGPEWLQHYNITNVKKRDIV